MDCVSPILNVVTCCWDRSAEHTAYIHDLEENLVSLRDKMKNLKSRSEDVERRAIILEEEQRLRRTNEVKGWLQSVEAMEKDVNEILHRGAQEIHNKCPGGCCPRNCRSSYKLGKLVTAKLNSVDQLMNRGCFDVVADRLPRAIADEKPMEKTVGLDWTFEKVWNWLRDDKVGIIGFFGTGGVGKTTLLKKINNEFLKISMDFEVVIWAEVSRDANAEEVVQDQILKRLGMSTTASQNENATEITRVLSGKKFVLLLDDLWKSLDLLKVGIPVPDNQNKSKVVFTTRFEDVCGHMDANKKIRVEYLPLKEAWELFRRKVGEDTLNLHPEIPKLAKVVAEKYCGGLPVAIIAIGRAMASRKTPQEWKRALKELKNNPSKFSGMGDLVFPRLKFSYDSLLNDTIKSCFIYCSLFSGDIWAENLVDLWIGEGFFSEFDDINEARNQGHEIIVSLKLACLLEGVIPGDCVRMHDVIRDMALWIACERERKVGKFLVGEASDRLIEGHEPLKWKEVERMTLSTDAIHKLNETLICPNLVTLLAQHKLKVFPSGFFQFMPALRVLDLSDNNITELPVEIGRLVFLQYLNLSGTNIRELPISFKNLENLKFLKLWDTPLQIIPEQVISSLSLLQEFNMAHCFSPYQIVDGNVLSGGSEALLAELECLEHLQDIRITIKTVPAFQMLLSSQKLRSHTSGLTLYVCEGLTSLILSSLNDMMHLKSLEIFHCADLKEVATDLVERRMGPACGNIHDSKVMRDGYFDKLTEVKLFHCHNILDLTQLIFIPNLQELRISNCKLVEELICDYDHDGGVLEFEEISSIFSRLTLLSLSELPELRSIYRHPLLFPSLQYLGIRSCPKLRKLPLDSNSAKNTLRFITIEKEAWDELEWDDNDTQLHFLPYFRPNILQNGEIILQLVIEDEM